MSRAEASLRAPVLAGALLLALLAGGCDEDTGFRHGADVRDFVQDYVGAIRASLPSLARTKAWPNQGFENVSVETANVSTGGGRIAYDVFVDVRDEQACRNALQGGLTVAREVLVGRLSFRPGEVEEREEGSGKGKRTVRPLDYLCHGRDWPVRLTFRFDLPLQEP